MVKVHQLPPLGLKDCRSSPALRPAPKGQYFFLGALESPHRKDAPTPPTSLPRLGFGTNEAGNVIVTAGELSAVMQAKMSRAIAKKLPRLAALAEPKRRRDKFSDLAASKPTKLPPLTRSVPALKKPPKHVVAAQSETALGKPPRPPAGASKGLQQPQAGSNATRRTKGATSTRGGVAFAGGAQCPCVNSILDDSIFCRKCGALRGAKKSPKANPSAHRSKQIPAKNQSATEAAHKDHDCGEALTAGAILTAAVTTELARDEFEPGLDDMQAVHALGAIVGPAFQNKQEASYEDAFEVGSDDEMASEVASDFTSKCEVMTGDDEERASRERAEHKAAIAAAAEQQAAKEKAGADYNLYADLSDVDVAADEKAQASEWPVEEKDEETPTAAEDDMVRALQDVTSRAAADDTTEVVDDDTADVVEDTARAFEIEFMDEDVLSESQLADTAGGSGQSVRPMSAASSVGKNSTSGPYSELLENEAAEFNKDDNEDVRSSVEEKVLPSLREGLPWAMASKCVWPPVGVGEQILNTVQAHAKESDGTPKAASSADGEIDDDESVPLASVAEPFEVDELERITTSMTNEQVEAAKIDDVESDIDVEPEQAERPKKQSLQKSASQAYEDESFESYDDDEEL